MTYSPWLYALSCLATGIVNLFLSWACQLARVGLRCLRVPQSCGVQGLRDGVTGSGRGCVLPQSLSGLSTVDFFPVFPRVFSPAVVMGFDLTGLVVWLILAPRSLKPRRSTPFARFVTFWLLCVASWGPPLFPHLLRRFLASCLAALPFASLPLVSRPWTVLSWSPLLSLSSVSDCFVVVPRQLVGFAQLPSFSR